MSPLHPHWQSTEDERAVPVRVKHSAAAPVSVSRAPAAIVGILSMVAVGFIAYGGLQSITGQVTNPTPDVTITLKQSGADPARVEVRPGHVIRWVNEDQQPHVLTSETLPTPDGKPFETNNLFPQDEYFLAILDTTPEGTHTYISEASEDIEGEIVITFSAAAASSASSVAPTAASSVPAFPAFSSSPFQGGTQFSAESAPTLPAGVIAVNPHVVGAKNSAGSTASRKPGVTQHKPTKNTESGPAVWLVLGCSAIALWAATKGAFKRV